MLSSSNSNSMNEIPAILKTYKSLPAIDVGELEEGGGAPSEFSSYLEFDTGGQGEYSSAFEAMGSYLTKNLSGDAVDATTPLPAVPAHADVVAKVSASKAGELTLRTRGMSWNDAPDANPPEYVLKREIGAGGMGTVYEADQACVGRSVALKVLRPELASMAHAVRAFTAEGAVTAGLEHPGIVPLYDLGHSELTGAPFYAMKRVFGSPWTRLIHEQTNAERVDVLLRVGDAVAFAHSRGIVHRDLKPDNVMIGAFGEVLVMDWGLAVSVPRESDEEVHDLIDQPKATPVTESTFGGTPAYMAPELTGPDLNKIGPWSDVYLLGAMLWRAITGRPPHLGDTLKECITNARDNNIAEPPEGIAASCNETGSAELVAIARKAMATDPAARYSSVTAFQTALREWEVHVQSAALTRRAAILLASAHQNGVGNNLYHSFSMAVYSYEEALNIWAENPCALGGLKSARLAFSRAALERGDLELAESVLSEAGGESSNPELAAEIQQERKKRACSEHHRATLARTAEKWSLAFELSPDAMIILREEDAVVLEANANFEKATGWPRSEVIGHSTADIDLWADHEARTQFVSMLKATGEVQGFASRFRRRSGEIYPVLVSACMAEFDGVRAVVANSRDLSNVRL